MAVSITDVAQASETELMKGVLLQVLRNSDIIGLLPWITKNTLRVQGTHLQELPDVDFRVWNGGYSEGTGLLDQWTDGLFPLGGDIQIEKQFTNLDETIEDPAVTQSKIKLAALSMTFNYYFIEGTPAGGGFTGLRHRIMNDPTIPARMRINLATAGDCLKVLASAANSHALLDAIHEGIDAVGGNADALIMNRNTRLMVSSVLRRQGLLDTSKDMFDRMVYTFGEGGPRLVDVGLQNDQATEIISNTEDPGDGGDDSTSMYVVRFGTADTKNEAIKEGDGLYGIQKNRLEVYDPLNGGEMEAGPQYLRRIDWPVTVSPCGDRYCIARIYGFRMAAT